MKTVPAVDPRQLSFLSPNEGYAKRPMPPVQPTARPINPVVPVCPRCAYDKPWPKSRLGELYAWCPECQLMFHVEAESGR